MKTATAKKDTAHLVDAEKLMALATEYIEAHGLEDILGAEDALADGEIRPQLIALLQEREAVAARKARQDEERRKTAALAKLKASLPQAKTAARRTAPTPVADTGPTTNCEAVAKLSAEFGDALPDWAYDSRDSASALRAWLCRRAKDLREARDTAREGLVTKYIARVNHLLIEGFGLQNMAEVRKYRAGRDAMRTARAQAEQESCFDDIRDQSNTPTATAAPVEHTKLQCPNCTNRSRKLFFVDKLFAKDGEDKEEIDHGHVETQEALDEAEGAGRKLACGRCKGRMVNKEKRLRAQTRDKSAKPGQGQAQRPR